ncbi:host-nuclease inhibitor Gam family protein [Limosilactobacillus sp. STM2_1]|uniref:Host-nuclease inhibitor Gam family protein n=1 Tax=Limosilactobacillus rudii TaxID=2759755 RepID=A0A7W3YMI8_9LACO|nr:host-nuclease inhibitor Gam family protein [Limosilactobacillus rudii]MBB1078932.1 host-nuclease inhibitor Gam family protein [Limosilactobacillus rudii]MBB1097113.1 host-nuclease inhibitor Gam family protein [Limosilactobacillus rudii]MCD7134107.1 host-nuclease inhibitor Gam family protein [Limosilactobacillus rudii]
MDQVKSQEQLALEQAMSGVSDDRFTLTDDGDVTWALGKLKEVEEKRLNNQKMVEEAISPHQIKIDQAKKWLAESNKKLDESRDYYVGLIREYTDPKQAQKATYKLPTPNGNISYAKKQPEYKHDDKKLLEVLPDEFIKTETIKKVKWGEFKKHIKDYPVKNGKVIDPETGEMLEGVEQVKPARREFTIKPIKEDK